MDPPTFDALLRRVARQMTRRAALATLLGGALLLHDPTASEATKEAQRRKDHRRKQRRRQARGASLRPISLWIDNTAGTSPVLVEHGERAFSSCCRPLNTISIPPGERQRFASSTIHAYVWIAKTYWLSFENPIIGRPNVTAAVDGQPFGHGFCCISIGETVLEPKSMTEGQTFPINLRGRVFSVRRTRDTNYKEFTVTLPATL